MKVLKFAAKVLKTNDIRKDFNKKIKIPRDFFCSNSKIPHDFCTQNPKFPRDFQAYDIFSISSVYFFDSNR